MGELAALSSLDRVRRCIDFGCEQNGSHVLVTNKQNANCSTQRVISNLTSLVTIVIVSDRRRMLDSAHKVPMQCMVKYFIGEHGCNVWPQMPHP